MTTTIIVVLVFVALYLAKGWLGARAEVMDLRVQVTSLKRRLTRVGR